MAQNGVCVPDSLLARVLRLAGHRNHPLCADSPLSCSAVESGCAPPQEINRLSGSFGNTAGSAFGACKPRIGCVQCWAGLPCVQSWAARVSGVCLPLGTLTRVRSAECQKPRRTKMATNAGATRHKQVLGSKMAPINLQAACRTPCAAQDEIQVTIVERDGSGRPVAWTDEL